MPGRLRFVIDAFGAGVRRMRSAWEWFGFLATMLLVLGVTVPTAISSSVPPWVRVLVGAAFLLGLLIEGAYQLSAGSPANPQSSANPGLNPPSPVVIHMNHPNQHLTINGGTVTSFAPPPGSPPSSAATQPAQP